jgi:hypothetical protein
MFSFSVRASQIALLLSLAVGTSVASAQMSYTVVVNGQPMSFDQPPLERDGRLYVPLRGVFERLGASVVYSNGTINATAGNTTIALQVGSNQALVGGQPVALDSPPFLIGGRVLVPLRFVSQALGASVNYDSSNETVYVNQQVAQAPHHFQAPAQPQPPPLPPGPVSIVLTRIEPELGTAVGSRRPEISATFEQPVDASSVRVMLDGRDVTAQAYVSDRSFVFDPSYDLPSGRHTVALSGRIAHGPEFAQHYSFQSEEPVRVNYIDRLLPGNGVRVGHGFDVTGVTLPGSQVHIVATSSAEVTQFLQVNTGSSNTEVGTAPDGSFIAHLDVPDMGGGVIDVRIQSTAPDGSSAIRTLRLLP